MQKAEVRRLGLGLLLVAGLALGQTMTLVPMDLGQTDHLKAYGVAYRLLQRGVRVEWLLNYRGGSFLYPAEAQAARECALNGVASEAVGASELVGLRATIEAGNMQSVMLERPTRVAVYAPPTADPWDDAVRLALDYAGIEYDVVWDRDVLQGKLAEYDWVHLHHEDFTGQFGKFYAGYRQEEWYQREVAINSATAAELGFAKVSRLKLAIVAAVRDYVSNGGMLFAMCSATDTPDIAWAAQNTDICDALFDGDPVAPDNAARLDYSGCLAFENFSVVTDPYTYEHSDIDTYLEATGRGPEVYFALFDFSAKYDPVPCMLVQNHVGLVKEFLGQNCGFRRERLKREVLVMGEVANTEEVKYIHGNFGRGTFTFLGGHDPEDYAHRIHDPVTELSVHKSSPGYRLILNNVLFPAAEKKPLKT
ncbi:asparagine synthetase B [candidate division WOR-3 bacterium]|nr:asparagine synthetase B [candidate division WOR-3 bacterium]